jgi:hypothetical protein
LNVLHHEIKSFEKKEKKNIRFLASFRIGKVKELSLKKIKMPRVLAIDYGQKHTGIAVTDEMQIIASGLTTIPVPFLLKIISLRRGRSGSYCTHKS